MVSYNTELVNGVMEVLERAGLFDLSIPEIIKLVEEKFPSTNTHMVQWSICPDCGGSGCDESYFLVPKHFCIKCGGSGKPRNV